MIFGYSYTRKYLRRRKKMRHKYFAVAFGHYLPDAVSQHVALVRVLFEEVCSNGISGNCQSSFVNTAVFQRNSYPCF